MFLASLLLAALTPDATITLAEAKAMTPAALARRLLPKREPRPVVDAIINGRGMAPPSASVNRVWLVEQMVPFDATTCRSHLYELEMEPVDPTANPWREGVATRPKTVKETDRLWVPPAGVVTAASCAAAPAQVSGFGIGGLDLQQASHLVQQARETFRSSRRFTVKCAGVPGACDADPRATLAALNWSGLSVMGHPWDDPRHDPCPPEDEARAGGPACLQFTFPYATANGATWFVTVYREPEITSVKMEAKQVIYE